MTDLQHTYEVQLSIGLKTVLGTRYEGTKFSNSIVVSQALPNNGYSLKESLYEGSTPDLTAPDLALAGTAAFEVTGNGGYLKADGDLTAGRAQIISCHFEK